MKTELQQIEAQPGQQDIGDKRKPTRYAVLLDGAKVGEVFPKSRESWGKDAAGRVRTTFRGYSRYWQAVDANGRVVIGWAYSRERAVQELVATTGAAT